MSETLIDHDDHDDDDDFSEPKEKCWRCCGQGWGIVGTDWDSDDPINGPYPGETERCPCCGGTGKAEDCTFW
jgi:hypothetical protein